MKKAILAIAIGALTLGANAGDWGKAPVYDKAPIEECIDLGGNIGVGYHTDYIYKGYRLGRDTISSHVNYTFSNLPVPVTVGVDYYNVINGLVNLDDLAIYAVADLGNHAGFDFKLSYTQRFYPEVSPAGALGTVTPNANLLGSTGEIGLHVARDLGFVTAKADLFYNLNSPADFVGGPNSIGNNRDTGAWFYDFGLEKAVAVGPANLVLNAGMAYSDNYFGGNMNGGGLAERASGWNHYYIRASLPIELNCRTTLTPYIGYNGAPDGWIQDGNGGGGQSGGAAGFNQSDILHGGVSLNVSF